MSTAQHHAEWLSLLEISGPFLSLPVLLDAFPQGLEPVDPEHAAALRSAYEEWADNQGGLQPDPVIHTAWIRYVLSHILGMPPEAVAEGQAIPSGLRATILEHHETITPDLIIREPNAKLETPNSKPTLLLQVYPATQGLEKSLPGHAWKASPATRMMELLYATEVRLGLVTNGEQWLLVQAKRGETTGYIGWYATLWLEERLTLRAFASLLGMYRFFGVPAEQTLPALLDASAKDQQEVTDQLGYQVRRAVEILVQAIDKADEDRGRVLLTHISSARLYEAALTVMMRLVFLLSAEERGLLLLGDPLYDQHYAISTLRAQLREMADQVGEEVLERRYDAWCRLLATFRAVFGGIYHENLHLPAYGGSLFNPDRFPFLEGRTKQSTVSSHQSLVSELETRNSKLETPDPLAINNRTVLHLLDSVQLLQIKTPGGGPAQARRLSFRALDIEQIGNVYEGLLDHIAVRAAEPILGLQGTKNREPEIPLARLEQLGRGTQGNSEELVGTHPSALSTQSSALLSFLQDHTGRSPSALKNALAEGQKLAADATRNPQHVSRLRAACGNDETLYRRILPWAGLLREDDLGYPTVILPGSVYVTAGTTRRATGTHYTPQTLTVPIVQHTLEPLVYIGPAEGWPREQWQLRTPAELLALKVCDMAMGSGAMLVQVDRYLAERLVEAWERVTVSREPLAAGRERLVASSQHPPLSTLHSPLSAETSVGPDRVMITPEGEVTDDAEKAIPADPEEQLRLARRLVADRCIYGVDKNPLAVEIAKLSLWLVTLDKNRPFTFLDHALKHGDSLIGADENMFLRWSQSLKGTVGPLYYEENEKALALARQKRRALQAFTVQDVRDAEEKTRLLAEADEATHRIKLGCDLLVGVQLLEGLNDSEREALLAKLLIEYGSKWEPDSDETTRALTAARQVDAFHWPFEFPEVFAQGGFSAFVGNPPFVGGRRIRETLGNLYREGLSQLFPGSSGNADYCAFFFLQAHQKLSREGALGFIATNTIAQGDTHDTGLSRIIAEGAIVFRATNNYNWPGQAAVTINIVHVTKKMFKPPFILDNKEQPYISSRLDNIASVGEPRPLTMNQDRSFQGSVIVGMGFTMSPESARHYIESDVINRDVLFPYINGHDVNSSPTHYPSRWIINFFDWPLEKAEQYPEMLKIVREEVKPQRDGVRREAHKSNWWHYGDKRPALYKSIAKLHRVLVCTQVSKHLAFTFLPNGYVYDQKLVIFCFDDAYHFALLQSDVHGEWAWKYSSTMRNAGISYSPTDVFYTFPLVKQHNSVIGTIGDTYYRHRCQIMLERQEGLTTTYNRFHHPAETAADIVRLRELHVEMDHAVASAYGWSDLVLGHGFHETAQGLRYTLSEPARREVLTRLLHLNHQRHEEELRQGLHDTGKSKKPAKKGIKNKEDGQMSLL